jgi:hypothetical protein
MKRIVFFAVRPGGTRHELTITDIDLHGFYEILDKVNFFPELSKILRKNGGDYFRAFHTSQYSKLHHINKSSANLYQNFSGLQLDSRKKILIIIGDVVCLSDHLEPDERRIISPDDRHKKSLKGFFVYTKIT